MSSSYRPVAPFIKHFIMIAVGFSFECRVHFRVSKLRKNVEDKQHRDPSDDDSDGTHSDLNIYGHLYRSLHIYRPITRDARRYLRVATDSAAGLDEWDVERRQGYHQVSRGAASTCRGAAWRRGRARPTRALYKYSRRGSAHKSTRWTWARRTPGVHYTQGCPQQQELVRLYKLFLQKNLINQSLIIECLVVIQFRRAARIGPGTYSFSRYKTFSGIWTPSLISVQ